MAAPMGWQDRDWAKLDDRELAQLYGVRRRRTIGVREGAATAIIVSAVATLALGRAHLLRLPVSTSGVDPAYPQHVIYGIRGTSTADPNGPGGTNTACTAASFDAARGWQCQSWAVDVSGLPIVAATPYGGTCADAKVDESTGGWLCISVTTPPQQATSPITS